MAKRKKKRKCNLWTPEELDLLRQLYPDHSCVELSQYINHSPKAIENRACLLGLKKDAAWMRERQSKGWYKKGCVSPWKGKTWDEMFTPEQQEKIRRNLIAPGGRAHNKAPIGHERKAVDGYWWVKVADPNIFKLKHRILWEQHHGPIPAGIEITFIDGDKDNITIGNLRAETHREKFFRCCCYHTTMPPELQTMIQLKGVLKRQINKIEKDGNNRSHTEVKKDEG